MNYNIALIHGDGIGPEIAKSVVDITAAMNLDIEWVTYNIDKLVHHNLYATGTTGKLISNIVTGYVEPVPDENGNYPLYVEEIKPLKGKVTCLLSGPLSGDCQIGAMIGEGKIDVLIFFCVNILSLNVYKNIV